MMTRKPRDAIRSAWPNLIQLTFVCANFLQPLGVEPGAVHALRAEMVLGPEPRRIVETGDGQVHFVAPFPEPEAQRSTAFAAKWSPRDRRAVVPVGLTLPENISLLHAFERDRDRSRR